MIAFAEDALDEARADLGWAEQRAERHRFSERGSFRLQEDQEVHHHDRADAGGNGQHQREQCKRQVFAATACAWPCGLSAATPATASPFGSADNRGMTAICSGNSDTAEMQTGIDQAGAAPPDRLPPGTR